MADEVVLIAELNIETGDVIDEQKEIGAEMKKLKEQLKSAKKSGSEYTEENIKAAAKLKNLTQQYGNNQKILQGLQATQSGQVKTVAQAEKAIAALNQQWKRSAQLNGENDAQTEAMAKQLAALRERYKELQNGVGNTAVNVGDYKGAISGALKETGAFSGGLGVLQGGFMKLKAGLAAAKVGFTTLRGAIAATGIGALVLAFVSLSQWFKRTEKGAQTLRVITAALGQVMQTMLDVVSQLGEKLFNTFSDPQQAIKDLGNSIKEFVLERIRLTLEGIKGLGTAFKKLFQGDFKEAAEAAKEAFVDLSLGLNPLAIAAKLVVDNVKEGIESIKSLSQEIQKDVIAAIALQRRENALLAAKREFKIEEIELETKLLEAREQASNKLLTEDQRLSALLKGQEVLNDLSQKRIELAKEELEIQRQRNTLSDSNEEDLEAEAELHANLLRVEKNRFSQQKFFTAQISAFKKKAQDQEAKDLQAALDAVDEALAEELEKNQEARKADWENEKALEEEKVLGRFETKRMELENQRALELESAETLGNDKLLVKKKFDAAEKNLEQQKQNAILGIASDAFGNLITIFGENSKIGKAAAIAQTTIETYKAAQSAYAAVAGIPIVGPGLGVVAAGAAIAGGIARVNKIRAIDPTKGTSGPSRSGGGGGISISSSSGGSGIGAGLSAGRLASNSNQAESIQRSFETALQNSPPVLVAEDYEDVEGRRLDIRNQSEL